MVVKSRDLSGPAGICGDLSRPAGICGDLSGFTLRDTLQSGCGAQCLPLSYSHLPRAKFSPGQDGLRFVVRPRPTLRTDGLPRCEHWLFLTIQVVSQKVDLLAYSSSVVFFLEMIEGQLK